MGDKMGNISFIAIKGKTRATPIVVCSISTIIETEDSGMENKVTIIIIIALYLENGWPNLMAKEFSFDNNIFFSMIATGFSPYLAFRYRQCHLAQMMLDR